MKKTTNYNLNKPEQSDYYNIEDFNSNADIVDDEINKLDARIKEHKKDIMPHTLTDKRTGKKYRYGYQVSEEGIPQTISEEVE